MDYQSQLVEKINQIEFCGNIKLQINLESMAVIIHGEVPSFHAKQLIGEAAIQMKCWKQIINQIVVRNRNGMGRQSH